VPDGAAHFRPRQEGRIMFGLSRWCIADFTNWPLLGETSSIARQEARGEVVVFTGRADERAKALPFCAPAAHAVAVDPKREPRIGVSQLVHDAARVNSKGDQDRCKRVAELVRGQPSGKGHFTYRVQPGGWPARLLAQAYACGCCSAQVRSPRPRRRQRHRHMKRGALHYA
jgi:hypothetical protein